MRNESLLSKSHQRVHHVSYTYLLLFLAASAFGRSNVLDGNAGMRYGISRELDWNKPSLFQYSFGVLDRIIDFCTYQSFWNLLKVVLTNVQMQDAASNASQAGDEDHAMEMCRTNHLIGLFT